MQTIYSIICILLVTKHPDFDVSYLLKKNEEGFVSKPAYINESGEEVAGLDYLNPYIRTLVSGIPSPGQYVLDGVIYTSAVDEGIIDTPYYNIFDFIPEDVFRGRMKGDTFSIRLQSLHTLYDAAIENIAKSTITLANATKLTKFRYYIRVPEQEIIAGQQDLDKWVDKNGGYKYVLREDAYYEPMKIKTC